MPGGRQMGFERSIYEYLKDHDEMGDELDSLFELRYRKGEEVNAFVGRVRAQFDKLSRKAINSLFII